MKSAGRLGDDERRRSIESGPTEGSIDDADVTTTVVELSTGGRREARWVKLAVPDEAQPDLAPFAVDLTDVDRHDLTVADRAHSAAEVIGARVSGEVG